MTKNNTEFGKFLKNEVNLNKDRLERLQTGVRGVTNCLKRKLIGFQGTERQGSYAHGTLIKPVTDNDEYDADIQAVMNPNPEMEPKDYINAVYNALKSDKNYADKIKRKTRCVTVDYAGDFHLDVVPRITDNGKHYIFNRIENEREETDGIGYRDWFNDKNRITGGNLKRVVRLLKYLRDHKDNYKVKSIILTTLAANAIKESDEGTEAVRTVTDTLVTVLTRKNKYIQDNSTMPEIINPVLPSENFNQHWDERKYANFRKMVNSHARKAQDAKDTETSEEAIKLWQDLFGDKFGKGSSHGLSGLRAALAAAQTAPHPTLHRLSGSQAILAAAQTARRPTLHGLSGLGAAFAMPQEPLHPTLHRVLQPNLPNIIQEASISETPQYLTKLLAQPTSDEAIAIAINELNKTLVTKLTEQEESQSRRHAEQEKSNNRRHWQAIIINGTIAITIHGTIAIAPTIAETMPEIWQEKSTNGDTWTPIPTIAETMPEIWQETLTILRDLLAGPQQSLEQYLKYGNQRLF